MSRYTGPRARISRRLNTNIFGTRGEARALEQRPYPPGVHGRSRRRGGSGSEYLLRLQEKQKARFMYGLTERQFVRVYKEASRRKGVTGENMLQFLELRLDNVVYRSGWALTRPQARQFVSHGHLKVNGKRVNIPSYRVRKGDVVELAEKTRENSQVQWNVTTESRTPPAWLEAEEQFKVKVYSEPIREQIDVPVREQLIVELYSR